MRSTFTIFVILFSNFIFAQNNFKIKLIAPVFENDSLFIGPAADIGNAGKIYNFTVEPNSNVSFLKDFNTVVARIKKDPIIIEGKIDYPQLMNISYYDPKINGGYLTKPFFIEKGNFIISVNKNKNLDYLLETNSPANLEYQKLRLALESYNKKLKPYVENDAKDIQAKHTFLQKYIKNNPNSFVAFWETVNDFSRFGFNKSYVKNLTLFSKNIKKTYSYIEFKKILDVENSTNVGGNFPDIFFENDEKITKLDFSKYNLTVIDYWSTTCKPCIEDLPKLVSLYEKYKDKNVNFISISDDIQKEKMDLAERILKKNNVQWKNYFDVKKEFPKKLNASGYPLQILVDSNGKIVERKLGELDQIEVAIQNYIK
jgi:thiol-disulfide isomerase/thioredoxin